MSDMQRTSAPHSDLAKLPHRVVVIDDDDRDLDYMATLGGPASAQRLMIDCFNSVQEAIELLASRGADLVILDDQLAYGERAEHSLERLRRANYCGPIAIVSGFVAPGRRERLMRSGIISFLDKDEIDRANLNLLIEMAKARDQMFRPAGGAAEPIAVKLGKALAAA